MSEYTQGPWRFGVVSRTEHHPTYFISSKPEEEGDALVNYEDNTRESNVVLGCDEYSCGVQTKDDAALIAAAPDLLEALEYTFGEICRSDLRHVLNVKALEDVIVKAGGRVHE